MESQDKRYSKEINKVEVETNKQNQKKKTLSFKNKIIILSVFFVLSIALIVGLVIVLAKYFNPQ